MAAEDSAAAPCQLCGKPMLPSTSTGRVRLPIFACRACGTWKPRDETLRQRKLPGMDRGRQEIKVRTGETEHNMQAALFDLIRTHEGRYPQLLYVAAVPNGGFRHPRVAVAMEREGVRAGVPDILIARPRGEWHGGWIEMKRPGGRVSAVQRRWIEHLRQEGYWVKIARSTETAWAMVQWYLEIDIDLPASNGG